MKKILLVLFSIFTLASCSLDNDLPQYHYEILPIDSYSIPDQFTNGGQYEIKLRYRRPTDCHFLEGIYYGKDSNIRTLAIQTTVLDKSYCQDLEDTIVETSFSFICTGGHSYIFKFYKGKDQNGEDIFENVEIPVAY